MIIKAAHRGLTLGRSKPSWSSGTMPESPATICSRLLAAILLRVVVSQGELDLSDGIRAGIRRTLSGGAIT